MRRAHDDGLILIAPGNGSARCRSRSRDDRMAANRWDMPDLGLGVGLRTKHFPHVLSQWPEVGFFEVLTENFLDTGGRPARVLELVAERYPIVLHGVSMSIGSTDPLDESYLRKVKALAERTGAKWV